MSVLHIALQSRVFIPDRCATVVQPLCNCCAKPLRNHLMKHRVLAGARKQADGTWKDYIILDSSDFPAGQVFPRIDAFGKYFCFQITAKCAACSISSNAGMLLSSY
jgi:hypothetical protein